MRKLSDTDVRRILTESDWQQETRKVSRELALLIGISSSIALSLAAAAIYFMIVH